MALSLARFSMTRFVVLLNVRRVSGVTRMGVPPKFLISEAKAMRLFRYCVADTPEVSFWSLWPNCV